MYSLVVEDKDSSVYTGVAERLINYDGSVWKLAGGEDIEKSSLVFGDKRKLCFNRLGHKPGQTQLINYYRGNGALCLKTKLVRTLEHYCSTTKRPQFIWQPESFVLFPKPNAGVVEARKLTLKELKLRGKQNQDERENFRQEFSKYRDKIDKNIWIAKSSAGAKGEGILISDDVDAIIEFVDKSSQGHVVQRYIDKPLLVEGARKFDIRCWVLVDIHFNIYLYKEGVLRTSSDPYDVDNLFDVTSHLTNHCLQEALSINYGRYEEGNEMFYDEFDRFLQRTYNVTIGETIIPQIKIIITDALSAVKQELTSRESGYESFQLFGVDVMVDVDLKVWLLEINASPACAQRLLPGLIDSMILTALQPVFDFQFETPYHNLFEDITSN